MDNNDSSLDKDTEIIDKLSKEIEILKKTIKEFRKNKAYSSDIRIAEEELFRLKNNLRYHRIDKRYKFLNMMMYASPPNFRIDDDFTSCSIEYGHLSSLGLTHT